MAEGGIDQQRMIRNVFSKPGHFSDFMNILGSTNQISGVKNMQNDKMLLEYN